MAAPLHILYFAWLRERAGTAAEDVPLPDGVADVGGLMAWLSANRAELGAAFDGAATVRCAVNQVFAASDTAVKAGDEVAFFPPVTGG